MRVVKKQRTKKKNENSVDESFLLVLVILKFAAAFSYPCCVLAGISNSRNCSFTRAKQREEARRRGRALRIQKNKKTKAMRVAAVAASPSIASTSGRFLPLPASRPSHRRSVPGSRCDIVDRIYVIRFHFDGREARHAAGSTESDSEPPTMQKKKKKT